MKKIILPFLVFISLVSYSQTEMIKKYINEGSWQLLKGYFVSDTLYRSFITELKSNNNLGKKSIPYWCVEEENGIFKLAKIGSIIPELKVEFILRVHDNRNKIELFNIEKLTQNNFARMQNRTSVFSNPLGYYRLVQKLGDKFDFFDDYRDFFNLTRSIPSEPSLNFQQIDFDPLNFEFSYCKKVLFFNVCGKKTAVLKPGPVLSDKDDFRNSDKNNYPNHYFENISDMTAYSEQSNPLYYNPTNRNYMLTAAITDQGKNQVAFFRDGSVPVYYGNKSDEYTFKNPIAVKELNGFIYILDKETVENRSIIVLKPIYNFIASSNNGGYSINYIGKINASDLGISDFYFSRSNDIGGYKKLNGKSYLVVPAQVHLLQFEINPITGLPIQNTLNKYEYLVNDPNDLNSGGFAMLRNDIIRLDCSNETINSPGYTLAIYYGGIVASFSNTEYEDVSDKYIKYAYFNGSNGVESNNLAFMSTENVWICTESRGGKLTRFSEEGRYLGGYGKNSKSEYSTDLHYPNAITPNPIIDPANPFRYRFMVASKWGFDTGLKMFAPVVAIPEIQVFEKADDGNIKVAFSTSGKWQAVEKALGIGLYSVKINDILIPQAEWENAIVPTNFGNLPDGQGDELNNYPNVFDVSTSYLTGGWNKIDITIRIALNGEAAKDVKQTTNFYWLPSFFNPASAVGDGWKINPNGNGNDFIYKPINIYGQGGFYCNNGKVVITENGLLTLNQDATLYLNSTSNELSNLSFVAAGKINVKSAAYLCIDGQGGAKPINLQTNFVLDRGYKKGVNPAIIGLTGSCKSPCVFLSPGNVPPVSFAPTVTYNATAAVFDVMAKPSTTYLNALRWEVVKVDHTNNDQEILNTKSTFENINATLDEVNLRTLLNYNFEPCSYYKISLTIACDNGAAVDWLTAYTFSKIVSTKPVVIAGAKESLCENRSSFTFTNFSPVPLVFNNSGANNTGFWSGLNISANGVLTIDATYPRSVAQTYTYTYTDSQNCVATAIKTVTVWPIPAKPSLSTNAPACVNNPFSIICNDVAPSTIYNWTAINDFELTNMYNILSFNNATVDQSSSYTVNVTRHGCISPNADAFSVVIKPLPTVFPGADEIVCLTSPIFALSGFSPTGGTWSGAGIVSGTNHFDPALAGFGVHTLIYSFADANGCTNTATKKVTVGPVITLINENTCLNASPFIPNVSAVVPVGGTAVWSANAIPLVSNLFDPAQGVGNYSVLCTYTDVNGCSNSSTKTINVFPNPAAPVITGAATVCVGDKLELAALTVTGVAYQWSGPNGFTANTAKITINSILANQAGSYSVIAIQNGCNSPSGASASTAVVVNPLPVVTATNNAPILICPNTTAINLTGTPANGVWKEGAVLVTSTYTPSTEMVGKHTLTYILTDANTCSNSASTSFEVLPNPVVKIISASPEKVCESVFISAELVADPTENNSPQTFTFQWAKNGVDLVGETNQTYTATQVGSYTVKVTNTCGQAVSVPFVLEIIAPPIFVVTAPKSICLSGSSKQISINQTNFVAGHTYKYDYFLGDEQTLIQTVTNNSAPIFTVNAPGSYSIKITDVYGNTGCTSKQVFSVGTWTLPALPTMPTLLPKCHNATAFNLLAIPADGVWSGNGVSAVANTTKYNDNFNSTTLNPNWQMINKTANIVSPLVLTSTKLTLTSNGVQENQFAAIARADLKGNFDVWVTVTNQSATVPTAKAGLKIGNDFSNAIVEGSASVSVNNNRRVVFSYDLNNNGTIDLNESIISTYSGARYPVRLRMVKSGNNIAAYYVKGTAANPTWIQIGTLQTLPDMYVGSQIALYTTSASTQTAISTFDNFTTANVFNNYRFAPSLVLVGAQTLNYSVTNQYGCVSNANVNQEVKGLPTISISTSLANSVCASAFTSGTLMANATGLGTLTYRWTRNGTNLNLNTAQITINSTGNYCVTSTDVCGTSTQACFNFEITPVPTIAVSSPSSICANGATDNILLRINNYNPIHTYAINWTNGVSTQSKTVAAGAVPAIIDDFNKKDINWTTTDLDNWAGSNVAFMGSKLQITGRGGDVWQNTNEFVAIKRSDIQQNFDVSVQILSQTNANDWAKAGIMVANNINAANRTGYCFVGVTPANGVVFQWDNDGDGTIDNNTNIGGIHVPVQIRLKRTGKVFEAFYAPLNTTNWIAINAPVTLPNTPANQQIALFSTSHDANKTGIVSFDNFKYTSSVALTQLPISQPGTYTITIDDSYPGSCTAIASAVVITSTNFI